MRLIRGVPGSGKTALVFREFADAIRSGVRNIGIVVPTATLVRHYQHELARSGLVFDPGTIMSLSRFALHCAPDLSLVPASLVRALVRDALVRLPLPEFTQVATTHGMADIVLETITRFENANCTPDRLSRVRTLNAHGKAFLRVWKDVDTAIAARGFSTRAQVIQHAAETVPACKVWIDGFLKFSPLEAGFLRAIAAKCDLTLTLTEGQGTEEARRLAMELGASDRLLPARERHTETIAVTASSPEREADEIARRIIELHGQGTSFPAIAVALRDIDTWLPLLRTTFDRFGIPARYYFSTPVRKHPVAIFLNGLISCALNDWDFTSTLAALRAHPAWGHSADFDRFDFRVREAMPGRGADALLSLCESDWLRTRIVDCLKISAWQNESARPSLWQRRFEQLADSLFLVRTIPAPSDDADVETARSHAAGLRAWSTALDTAAVFFQNAAPISLEQFHAAVSDAVDSAGMQLPDNRHNVVHVMSAFEARQWQVEVLFVPGMTARDYPRAAAPDLLFPDGVPGIPLRTAREEERDEEQLFEALKTRASRTLILTASTHDNAGKTIVPSRHLTDVQPVPAKLVAHALMRAASTLVSTQGVISEHSLPTLAEQHRSISLTALEELAKCRFRFFAARSLHLKGVPDRPNERLSFSAIGLIVHLVMESWLTDQTRDIVDLFESTFDEFCREKHIQSGYKLEVERILLRRVVRNVSTSTQWPASSQMEVDCSFDFAWRRACKMPRGSNRRTRRRRLLHRRLQERQNQ